MVDRWYKNAIFYQVDVKTFKDSEGEGIGTFEGLIEQLPYIAGLGATCVWLHPFYPSPLRDDGYDVAEYCNVDPRLGTLGDFVSLVHRAETLGVRVIIDLVINHTSDRHPWFQEARLSETSPYRDFYIWSKEEPLNKTDGIVFPGYQEAIWKWDDAANAYYHHRFYEFQPDLNLENPILQQEICKIIKFWLKLGVSGFRIDAAPFLIDEPKDSAPEDARDRSEDRPLHSFLRDLRQTSTWLKGDSMLLAEANVPLSEASSFLAKEPQLHSIFNFPLNQQIFLALAEQRGDKLCELLNGIPKLPRAAQFTNFLRNHDELDLARLSGVQRQRIFDEFGPDESMQIYGRGLRRRLAPMVNGDRRRLELAYSLLFSLPGTPMIRYGDELGMGENLALEERLSVRTPMQWTDGVNGGFSTASPAKLFREMVGEGEFHHSIVNVSVQDQDAKSLLNWMRGAIRIRKTLPELGAGKVSPLSTSENCVLAHSVEYEGWKTVALHNFAATAVALTMIAEIGEEWREVFGGTGKRHVAGKLDVTLEPFGYCWYRVQSQAKCTGEKK